MGSRRVYEEEEESDLEEDQDESDDDGIKEKFNKEVKETIDRCIKDKFPISNVLMEIRSLKLSDNMSYSDCVEAIIPALLEFINS